MNIRSEEVSDYAAIADVHARAFGHRAAEGLIVALLRQHPAFNPNLSLVAVAHRDVIGHALFFPYRVRLLGQTLPAVNLAPLAVTPAWQGRGVGSALVAEGHARAVARGYHLSFLLGHKEYYPRFGYQTHAFGPARLELDLDGAADDGLHLERRDVVPEDGQALHALWHHDEADVDFALDPGPNLLNWISPNPAIRSSVYTVDGKVVGYTRVHQAEPAQPRVLLARDGRTTLAIARLLAVDAGASRLVLPIHPSARAATGLPAGVTESWAAAMACNLTPHVLDAYLAQVRAARLRPGRPTWPVEFDLS